MSVLYQAVMPATDERHIVLYISDVTERTLEEQFQILLLAGWSLCFDPGTVSHLHLCEFDKIPVDTIHQSDVMSRWTVSSQVWKYVRCADCPQVAIVVIQQFRSCAKALQMALDGLNIWWAIRSTA